MLVDPIPQKFREARLLHQQGRLARAQVVYREILELQPRHFQTLHCLGMLAGQSGNWSEALQYMARAVEVEPDNATAHADQGLVQKKLRQWQAALASYDRAITLEPTLTAAHVNRGVLLKELQQWDAALASYDRAIALKPDFAEAHFNRGNLLEQLGQWDAALAGYDRAIALKPDYAAAHSSRGGALKELARWEEALASYDRAVALKPDYAEAWSNRGLLLQELNQWDAALASYTRAIAIDPEFAGAHFNRGIALLIQGDYRNGWAEYEWRWKNPGAGVFKEKREFRQPLWLGRESIVGRTVLVYAEQGLGDAIQFCRYVPAVAALGARVILEVPAPLAGLLSNLEGVSTLLVRGHELPEFDYHCPLLSLPLAFNTTLKSIPAPDRYLGADRQKVAIWRSKLGARSRPRVGLAWSGNAAFKKETSRRIPLARLIAHLPDDFEYFRLQKDLRESDRPTLEGNPRIRDFTAELADFSDTAALCECMDLVVSTCTSVAHLAGALGGRTWILLAFSPDWRWLLNRSDSPWYRSARLYRQERAGDWDGVMRRVSTDLAALIGHD